MNVNNSIHDELKEMDSILANLSNSNVYTVPQGYFEATTNDIIESITGNFPVKIEDNSIPPQYFENLPDTIMNRIRETEAISVDDSFLGNSKDINVYKIPDGFFDSFPASVLTKLQSDFAEPSFIDSLDKTNLYTIPAGYFEGVSTEILKTIPKEIPVIQLKRSPTILRYAVAAVVSGIIGLSVVSIFNKKEITEPSSATTAEMLLAKRIINTNSIDDVFSTLTKDDIVSYLEKNGEDVDAALVASLSDDKELPEEVDYLTDDNTLETLLNGLINEQVGTN